MSVNADLEPRDPDHDREILDALQPVAPNDISAAQRNAARTPPPPSDSAAEHARRIARGKADQSETGQQRKRQRVKSRKLGPALTTTEAIGMSSTMARTFYDRAMDDTVKGPDRKHAAIGYGVSIDKWTVVSGRPVSVIADRETETTRPALLDLAAEIARATTG